MGLFWMISSGKKMKYDIKESLSSWDEVDVHIKLLADGVWSAEDDKTGFLSVGVDIFDQLYL